MLDSRDNSVLKSLKELRKQYRNADADADSRARIVQAGRAIRRMQAEWPERATDHVRCVLEAVHRL